MSQQRSRLAKYVNQRQWYRATFNVIKHDKQNQPQVLLTDIYPVYANGRKIPLRSKINLTNTKGQQIAADHVWTSLNSAFLKAPCELLMGDLLQFSAVVNTYPIKRDNVQKKRELYWQQGTKAKEQVYQDYLRQRQMLYQNAQVAKQKAYQAHVKHLLTFTEMQLAQNDIDKQTKTLQQKAYRSCQNKMKRRIRHAQKEIATLPLVDYDLTKIEHVTVIKFNTHYSLALRCHYDCSRLHDLRYTKFLAAHSMAAKQDNLAIWTHKEGVNL